MLWFSILLVSSYFFFFQAEDGIRDHCVTGVQTCALPICMDLIHLDAGAFHSSHKRRPILDPYCEQRSEEHTTELQSHSDLVCRLLLEKKKTDRRHGRPAARCRQ